MRYFWSSGKLGKIVSSFYNAIEIYPLANREKGTGLGENLHID